MRTTEIGKSINSYLTSDLNLDDRVIHLLFSANRWEMKADIDARIERGEIIVCDRYAYSGACYSAAKDIVKQQIVSLFTHKRKYLCTFVVNYELIQSRNRVQW